MTSSRIGTRASGPLRLVAALILTSCVPDAEPPIRDPGTVRLDGADGPAILSRTVDDTLSGVEPLAEAVPPAAATGVLAPRPAVSLIDVDPAAYLRELRLLVPVAGMSRDELPPSNFDQARGTRRHEAYDILAPRGTPVLAATGGRVAALHVSEAGGNTVYTIDRSERFVLFYAHLDRYHPGIHEGMPVSRGDTVGYVGTTGNAPPTVPHLHFAIVLMGEERRWWSGTPLDPQPLLARD
ncbi:MAG TPA: M23 family metallopeptidase [Gemmatimonadaceae bacterium]|nr:M23 family metallopeptidase [Gemmatimonadaceae bacterium]